MEKKYSDSLKILKIEPACYPAIPLWGIYLKNMKTLIWKDICAPLLIIALSASQDMDNPSVHKRMSR